MSKQFNVAWSTVMKQTASMPKTLKDKKRGIYLGMTKDGFIKVVKQGNSTYATYSPDFWEVDNRYMSDREKIANLMGRIEESNEPSDVEDFRDELDTIQQRMKL